MNNAFRPEAEIIDGYEVSSDVKALWNVEVDILHEFDRICQKYGLRWYATGGTLLGAVRHHGFIPWDDDMDVVMLQEDYLKFIEIAPQEFRAPYFFQFYTTDEYATPFHVKIRRSDTTGCTPSEIECMSEKWNKGIFFDVFPRYNVPDNTIKRKILYKRLFHYRRIINLKRRREARKDWKRLPREHGATGLAFDVFYQCFCKKDYLEVCKSFLQLSTKCGNRTKKVGGLVSSPGGRFELDRGIFDEIIQLPFGTTTVNAPKRYDELLRIQYGDYMKPVKEKANHGKLTYDVKTPYTAYFSTNGELV